MFVVCINPNFDLTFVLAFKFKKTLSLMLFGTFLLFMFAIAITPASHLLCLIVFQILCHSIAKSVPSWLSILLILFIYFILLSNDIHLNPGLQYHNNFNFMSWNLNSLATNNFERVPLIEAHNSKFNYDLISICETSLNDSLVPKVPELNGYTFEPANHPNNVTHGGVGFFL